MSNRAWMPLHIADYLADTGHLTAAEHGAYMLLIMHYWQNGSLPENEKVIARVAKLTTEQWDESREVLAMLFGPNWSHKRIDAELNKADDIIGKRRAAAEARYGKGKSKPDASELQMDSTSTYTGEKPFTDNLSPSLRSEDADASNFEIFWAAYPNRIAEPAARKAFFQALKRATIEQIMVGVLLYAAKRDDRQWCNPVKWLSEDRWNDQPAPPPEKPPPKPNGLAHLQAPQSREEYLRIERERSERSFQR